MQILYRSKPHHASRNPDFIFASHTFFLRADGVHDSLHDVVPACFLASNPQDGTGALSESFFSIVDNLLGIAEALDVDVVLQ